METIDNGNKGSVVLAGIGITGVVMSMAAIYIAFNTYTTKYVLGKSQFICTQIEQVGKNMDDVVCTQYTAQKHAKAALAANSLVASK